jgi:hypothetical protein
MPVHDTRDSAHYRSPQGPGAPTADTFNRGRFRFMLPPFLLGMLAAQYVEVFGRLYLGEVFGILLLFPILFGRDRLTQTDRRLLLFGALWAAAQALSDFQNLTAVHDSLKGVFTPLVFVATIVGLSAYFRTNVPRMPSFLLGAALGPLLGLVLFPNARFLGDARFIGDPWKWGLGTLVLLVLSIHYSFFLRQKTFVWLLVWSVGIGAVSVYLGSRGLAVLTLFAVPAYMFIHVGSGMRFVKMHISKRGAVPVVLMLVAGAFVTNLGVTAFYSSDTVLSRLSPGQVGKNEQQVGGRLGILVGGRGELFASVSAFVDKPLLGHGSLPRDTGGYYAQKGGQILRSLGYVMNPYIDSVEIPTHSFLMQGLVWAGIMGGLFWIVLVGLVLKQFLKAAAWLPVYYYIGLVSLLWGVLFSPFPAITRWETAIFLGAFFAVAHSRGTLILRKPITKVFVSSEADHLGH